MKITMDFKDYQKLINKKSYYCCDFYGQKQKPALDNIYQYFRMQIKNLLQENNLYSYHKNDIDEEEWRYEFGNQYTSSTHVITIRKCDNNNIEIESYYRKRIDFEYFKTNDFTTTIMSEFTLDFDMSKIDRLNQITQKLLLNLSNHINLMLHQTF